MRRNIIDIILILALVVVAVIAFGNNTKYKTKEKEYKQALEKLEKELKVEEDKRLEYAKSIDSLNIHIGSLNEQIELNNIKIIDLRKKYNETINSVNTFSSGDIQQYFATRYGTR